MISTDSQRALRVFISSPGGLEIERKIIRVEVEALSGHEEKMGNRRMSVVEWPTDIGAGVDAYLQSVVNRQTEDIDILICLVADRMGTPTPRANSGTDEEFDRVMDAVLRGASVPVVVFFSNIPVRPQDVDPDQLMLVRAFREKAGRLGVLYHTFNDHEEFRRLLKNSLQEAYNGAVGRSPVGRLLPGVKNGPPASPQRIVHDKVSMKSRETAPQRADQYLISLSKFRGSDVRLTGLFETASPYFRFGFKLYDSREALFSAGSIQTFGKNILFHIGRDVGSPNWFVTNYRGGYRNGSNVELPDFDALNAARFCVDISRHYAISLSLEDKPIYKAIFPFDGLPTLAILAWSDEHEFSCRIDDLVLEILPGHDG